MAGVIDENGTQWERCNACSKWVDIYDLCYGPITAEMADEIDAKAKAWAEEERPEVTCDLCDGTGVRPGGLEEFGQSWFDWCGGCNGCHGKGVRPEGGHRGWQPVDRTSRFDLCSSCNKRAGNTDGPVGPAAIIAFNEDGTASGMVFP